MIYKIHHNNIVIDQLPFFDDPFCIEWCLGGLEAGLELVLFSSRFILFFPEEVVSLVIGSGCSLWMEPLAIELLIRGVESVVSTGDGSSLL